MPLPLEVATPRPRWRVEVARGATDLLVQRPRGRTLDAVVVDLRSLEPAVDLAVDQVSELRGAFMVRPGHPPAGRAPVSFADLSPYPLASIPLSAEVSRMLVERHGSQAHPEPIVSVRREDVASLVEVAESSDAGPRERADARARFGPVRLERARRTRCDGRSPAGCRPVSRSSASARRAGGVRSPI